MIGLCIQGNDCVSLNGSTECKTFILEKLNYFGQPICKNLMGWQKTKSPVEIVVGGVGG